MTSRVRRYSRALLSFALLGALLGGMQLWWGLTPAQAYTVPYSDPYATGYIGLCDGNGLPVVGGNINDKPFVRLAVSSSPTPNGWTTPGKTATLLAAQPVQGIPPEYWQTSEMAGTAYYTNSAHPMVVTTSDAYSIKDFMTQFPINWDGLIQLRMYFNGPGLGAETATYPATDIQVTGDTWTVVRGGNVDCNAGFAVSTLNAPAPPLSTPSVSPGAPASGAPGSGATHAASLPPSAPSGAGTTPKAGGTGAAGSASPGGTPGASGGPAPASTASLGPIGSAASPPKSGGGSTAAITGGVVLALVLATVLITRRRRPKLATENPAPDSAGEDSG